MKTLIKGLDIGHVEDVSFSLRSLLVELCPELVNSVEDFAERVIYIPISTIGHSPTVNPRLRALEVRPADIKPIWPAVPFLYALARLGMVYRGMKSVPAHENATLVQRIDGMMFCSLSDGTRLDIPVRYAGRTIHHPRTGIPIAIPKV